MSISVIVNGANGKMGALACETIRNHPQFELVGALGRQDNLAQTIRDTQAQIVIDLTRADCVYENCLAILENGARAVVGTTGLSTTQLASLSDIASMEGLGIIIAPNFSISAILMMRFAAQAARYLSSVEIIETHHPQKFDAPSGTAIKTAELIAAARETSQYELPSGNELIKGVRGGLHQDIPIHSLRLPGVVARQQVIFGNIGETLSITHDSIDRIAFMPGLVLCCQKVMEMNTLCYGLENIIA